MATLAALEAKLRADPNDRATWLVYADALQEMGDPRGEVIALGERIRDGDRDLALATRYSERCRAARWPREAPFPRMHYALRFEQMFAELRARPGIQVESAKISAPNRDDLARFREIAGASWPDGMTELYEALGAVDLDYHLKDDQEVGGAIRIPPISLWSHEALEGALWFDFTEPESALHFIRPIDHFVPEACAVLYLRPEGVPAEVAYHYCGESLIPTGLSYREWLELLFRSRGALYWLLLTVDPEPDTTWVGQAIERLARLFPDFDPGSMRPDEPPDSIEIV